MKWDYYEYQIAEHYLSALINGDYSSFDDSDCVALDNWVLHCKDCATENGFKIGHWACDIDESGNWGHCAITGLLAMRATVRLMVYTK